MKATGASNTGDVQVQSNVLQEKHQSLSEIYCRYYQKVYHTCFFYMKNHEDAFDLAQDVMLKAFSSLEAFEGKSTFSTWLFAITRNHCLSMISKRRRVYYEDVQFAKNLIAEETSGEELKIRQRKEQLEMELQDYLDHLPVMDKQLLELKYFKKYSVKELQEEFNLSASAVKMRLLRARQKMEQLVDFSFAA